jgi:hypothetical protein
LEIKATAVIFVAKGQGLIDVKTPRRKAVRIGIVLLSMR